MLKLSLVIVFCGLQLTTFAQKQEGPFGLYLHREKNGVTEIIDTSFESKAAMHQYLKSLPPAELNLKNKARVRIHRFDEGGNPVYLDKHFQLADSLMKRSRVYHFDKEIFSADSLNGVFKFFGDSTHFSRHWFSFPATEDTGHFRQFLWDNDQKMAMAFRDKALSARTGNALKHFQFKLLEEVDKKNLDTALGNKLSVSTPPLQLEELKVFPNPGDGLVQLSFRVKDTATLKIRVLNAAGQSIFAETLPGVTGLFLTEIDLRNAGKGMYYVYISHGKKSAVRKLLIH